MHAASMVLGPTIPELVRDGHLAPTRTLRLPNRLNLDGLKADKHGEYRRAAVGERVTETVVADAVSSYLRYARGRQTIFFGIDRAHSERVCAKMREAGIRAVHVDGSDSDGYRDRVMNDFRQGAVQVVANCDLISEGFDAPTCSCVMLGAPTRSVTRYLQAAGRAMRPGPEQDRARPRHGRNIARTRPTGRTTGVVAAGRRSQEGEETESPAARMRRMSYGLLRTEMPALRPPTDARAGPRACHRTRGRDTRSEPRSKEARQSVGTHAGSRKGEVQRRPRIRPTRNRAGAWI